MAANEDLQGLFLHHQCLITPAESIEAAVDRMLGLRGAEGSTPYLSLCWRVQNFRPEEFDAAVHQHRRLLRLRGPRGTYFWVSVSQAPIFIAAFQTPDLPALLDTWGITEGEYLTIRDEVHQRLSGGALKSLWELKASLPARLQRRVTKRGAPPSGTLQVTLEVMQNTGELTALKEPGFSRHWVDEYHGDQRDVPRPNLFGLVADLYPQVAAAVIETSRARVQLLERYIRTFGPVTIEDMAWWTGWKKSEIKQQLKEIQPQAVQIRSREYWFLPGALPAAEADWQSVHLLPGGDSALKGYSVFDRFLHPGCPDHNLLRFNPVVLHHGIGLGNWGYRRINGYLEIAFMLFETPSPHPVAALETAAHRLGTLLASPAGTVRCHFLTQSGPWQARATFPALTP